ncbi:MAG: CPBP family intramembrane glutamic endopeptidase [Patescibacteria group bacterium]
MVFGQIFLIFVLPIILLYLNILPKEARVFILILACLLIYAIIKKEKYTLQDLGISVHTFKKYLIPYLCLMTLSVIVIISYSERLEMEPQPQWWTKPHFLFLFLVVSFLQEFAYRSFLVLKLKQVFGDRLGIVLINALLFTLLHIIYPIPQVMLPLAFIGGLAFTVIYMKYPNLFLISLTHSVLNFVAVLHGFFVIYS